MSEAQNVVMLIGGIAILLGLIFFLIGTIRRRMTRGWVSTTGQVISKRGDPLSGMPARYPTFRWQDANGVEHQRTSNMGASLGPRPGTLVPVKYDPDNPSRAMIDSSVQGGQLFVVLGIVIAVVGLLGMAYGLWVVNSLS